MTTPRARARDREIRPPIVGWWRTPATPRAEALLRGWASSQATGRQMRRREPDPEPHIEVTRPGELVGIDCFSWVGCAVPGSRCGSSLRSMSIPATPGPSWSAAASPRRPIPHAWCAGWRPTSPAPTGGWSACYRTTARNSPAMPCGPGFSPARGPGDAHPRRAPANQRTRREPAPHDPRGMLAPELRPGAVSDFTALRRDLKAYIAYYNRDRTHDGRITKGRIQQAG